MDLLIEACLRHLRAGQAKDFVTGNNDADAVYLLRWAQPTTPSRPRALRQRLLAWGGNASG